VPFHPLVGRSGAYCHPRISGRKIASAVEISAKDLASVGEKLAQLVNMVRLID
jgi:hypothetical protein